MDRYQKLRRKALRRYDKNRPIKIAGILFLIAVLGLALISNSGRSVVSLTAGKVVSGFATLESSTTTAKASEPVLDLREIENGIHQEINKIRIRHGLDILTWDFELRSIASAHSEDMADNNFFSHTNLQGDEPSDRAKAVGYSTRKRVGKYIYDGIGENILTTWTYSYYDCYSEPVDYLALNEVNQMEYVTFCSDKRNFDWNSEQDIINQAVDGWMNSPGHRQNILTKMYDNEGIGVAISSNDEILITQNFW